MERLVRKLPIRYYQTKCLMKFFEDDSLAGYFRGSLSLGVLHNISFPLDTITKSQQVKGNQKRSLR